MANKKNKPLFGGFDRLQSFPLDSSSVFETWGELQEYARSKIAYHGQLVVCLESGTNYGAYILQDKTGNTSTSSTIFWPYKLYGTEEFTKEVGELKNRLDSLKDDFDRLSDEEVAALKDQVTRVDSWLDSIKDDANPDGGTIFATKARLDDINTNLNNRINELLGTEFTAKLEDLASYRPTINRLWGFVQEYGPMLKNALEVHGNKIEAAENLLADHGAQIDGLLRRYLSLQERVSIVQSKLVRLIEHENRIIANENAIYRINQDLKCVERFAEYDFGSRSEISGPEFATDMVIKEIEIVIDETGENIPGGIFNDDTKMHIDFPSTNNPQNATVTIIPANELFIAQGLKIVLDVDYQPEFNGHLRFVVENSEGLSGHAHVKYIERSAAETPKYSVSFATLPHIHVLGQGLYAENDQVTIELVPETGYSIELDNIGAQTIIAGNSYNVVQTNGIFTIRFNMFSKNIIDAYINGVTAVKCLGCGNYSGIMDTTDPEYYEKLAVAGNTFEWLPVYRKDNRFIPYPLLEDNRISIYLSKDPNVENNTVYYLHNAYITQTSVGTDMGSEGSWIGYLSLGYDDICTERQYADYTCSILAATTAEDTPDEAGGEPNGGE